MSTYHFYTDHFEGSICQDGSLNIKHITAGGLEEDPKKVLNLPNFIELTKNAENTSQILQVVLSHFAWSFEPQKDHRNELATILRYYVFAENYKLLVPQDVASVKLAALTKDYEALKEKYPDHCEETIELNNRAKENHINTPLVSSTGLIVFATLNYVWIAEESETVNPDAPEYLFNLTEKQKGWEPFPLTTAPQNKCIQMVMDRQLKLYGFNLETVVRKNNENKHLLKVLKELELILKIPITETYGYEEEQAIKKQEEAELVEDTERQLEKMRKGTLDANLIY